MKIIMLTTAAGPDGSYQSGQELEVGTEIPEKLAAAFVHGGYARAIARDKTTGAGGKPAAEKVPEVSKLVVETAAVEPVAEKAVIAPVKKMVAKKPRK
jgi:hypothetical protein